MADCWEIIDADLNHWAPWVRFFATSDGQHFVIDADLAHAPGWVSTVVRRKTALLYCTPDADVTDLNADAEFPPMTTPEQAIAQLGYTLVAPPTQDQGATA